MVVFRYDKTFEGLLTAVFDAYSRKAFPDKLISEQDIVPMFAEEVYQVITQSDRSGRVWTALQKYLPKKVCHMLWAVWLSEDDGCGDLMFSYIRKVFDTKGQIVANFNDADMLQMFQIAQKVNREAEYVRQFARFQKAADDMFFAPLAPKCNALPLTVRYFKDRFADQKWVVYDMLRKYGFYYDLNTVVEITLEGDSDHLLTGKLDETLMAEDEKIFQELWKGYFKALAIKERINPKLHRQNMPVRFWKYLTEKQ